MTDANLLLGYLDPAFFLGGRMKLDVERARTAIHEHVARWLGVSDLEAAWRIHALANTAMGTAVRMVTVHRGVDPRNALLVAFGGAGPLHAVNVAEEFGIPNILIPPMPGVRSAFGLLQSDVSYDFIKTARTSTADPDLALLRDAFELLAARASSETGSHELKQQRSLEIRFTHQSLRLRIPIPSGEVTAQMVKDAEAQFRLEYFRMCAINSGDTCQIVNCWIEALAVVAKPKMATMAPGDGNPARALKAKRRACFRGAADYTTTALYSRELLLPGDEFSGPALIDEPESTTVLPPGYAVRVDEHLNMLITAVKVPELHQERALATAR